VLGNTRPLDGGTRSLVRVPELHTRHDGLKLSTHEKLCLRPRNSGPQIT
jgi:hypothetical protein